MECKNCGVPVNGHFCSNCSQKTSTGRLKVKHVLHEFWHNFTHTDKGYLSLAGAMIIRPGKVIREYIEGKRKKYFNPYTFYLITTGALVFIKSHLQQHLEELYHDNNEFGAFLTKNSNLLLFCCLPVLALLLQLIFVKKKYNYAEWVTMLIFTFGLVNFFEIWLNLLFFLFAKDRGHFSGVTNVVDLALFLYVLIRFVMPANLWGWLQCLISTVGVYCVLLLGLLVALSIKFGIPFGVLFSKASFF